ncbi:MAG: N-acetylmuramoyl-L-alanine amidase [Bacteroidota bacterium]
MKKILLLAVFAVMSLFSNAQVFADQAIEQNVQDYNNYVAFFNKAYEQHPEVPKGILEAIAYTNSRFHHIEHKEGEAPSCIGIPKAYGIMGLTLDGRDVFKNNLVSISQLSGYTIEEIIESPEKNILAYAKAYSVLKKQAGITSNAIEAQIPVMVELSELPGISERNDITIGQDFALNAHIYTVLDFLNKTENQTLYNLPERNVDFIKVFGQENYNVLSAQSVAISEEGVTNRGGDTYTGGKLAGMMSPDYGPALWVAACPNNYDVGRSMAVSAIAIHQMDGTYAGTISWFSSCDNYYYTSSEYVLRSSDGQITQMVLESNTAHHVYTENSYTIGLEHEGYIKQNGWYTTAMYNASSTLVKNICSRKGVSPLTCWYGISCNGNYTSCLVDQCIRIKGHNQFPNGGHTDPGVYWDWPRYYKLLNPMPSVTPLTAASGTIYDSGGASGNYANTERPFTLIAPPGAGQITLIFTSFNMEANADHLFIYDGSTTAAPLLGKFTGTTSPGTITSTGGAMLIEFRSDCSVTSSGWAANWTAPGVDNTAPTTTISAPGTWITQNFTANFTDVDNSGGSGIEKSMYHVVNYDGAEWRANNASGFFRDNFNTAVHADWSTNTGTWGIIGGYLQQSDEGLANTNISASLTQNLSNRYLYNWSGRIEGAGTTRRAGFHFMCDNATAPNRGNSYMVWFRADQNQLEIYKSVNDVLGSPVKTVPVTITPGTWYNYKVVYDRALGTIDVYINNALKTTWTDTAPLQNGSYISFRNGDCKYSIDDLQIYRSRNTSVTVTVGAASTNMIRYQNTDPTNAAGIIKSIVMDNAGNLSTVASKSVDVDWTAPADVTVIRDGTGSDINTTSNTTQLSANWDPTVDPHSDVVKYYYAIGTTAGATNVVNWTDNGLNIFVTKTGLNLTSGQMYYFSIKAENGAGLQSTLKSSNGQLVQLSTGIVEETNVFNMIAYPNPFTENIAVLYELKNDQDVRITLVDVLGKEIVVNTNDNQSAGTYNVSIHTAELGLAPGMYVVKLTTNEGEAFIKLIHN